MIYALIIVVALGFAATVWAIMRDRLTPRLECKGWRSL